MKFKKTGRNAVRHNWTLAQRKKLQLKCLIWFFLYFVQYLRRNFNSLPWVRSQAEAIISRSKINTWRGGASCVQNYKTLKNQKTHKILNMNARSSAVHTKIYTWTQESLWWTLESLDLKAQKTDERTNVWIWTNEVLLYTRKSTQERKKVCGERKKVWT